MVSPSTIKPVPSAEQQLRFLKQIQLLLTDSVFSSTYKYALLLALTELAVEQGTDSGDALALSLTDLAEKVITLYWPQTLPYVTHIITPAETTVFRQNNGKQAAILNSLIHLRQQGYQTLTQARRAADWTKTVKQVAQTLKLMPIQYLQNMNGQTSLFLYHPDIRAGHLVLQDGVMYCLRQFQGIIQQLVRQRWIEFIKRHPVNQTLLGEQHDLESFLFGTPRAALKQVELLLSPMQNYCCFFCENKLTNKNIAVDHFIPWSRYPRDTPLNFVVAHQRCNSDKLDLLAAERHVEKWLMRNQQEGMEIYQQLQNIGFTGQPEVSKQIAYWAYQQAVEQNSYLWVGLNQDMEFPQTQIINLFS